VLPAFGPGVGCLAADLLHGNDWMEVHDKDENSIGWKLNGEYVHSRLRVDIRKWIASKLKPKRYGERVDLNHGTQPDDPLAQLIRSVNGSCFKPVRQVSSDNDEEN
jgi:hypothetical protein